MNFNAVDNANNLTILNTVNQGMSTIKGQINANSGIGKLIISNPNGMLYDGASFTTAGDLMLTTKDLSAIKAEDLKNLSNDLSEYKFVKIVDQNGKAITVDIKNGTVFNIGGQEYTGNYSIIAPVINAEASTINAKNIKLVTANGQDYVSLGSTLNPSADIVNVKAMNLNGDVVVTAGKGVIRFSNGGTVGGSLDIDSDGHVLANYNNNGEKLIINGDMDAKANHNFMFLRNAEVKGDLTMKNTGGFVDVGDSKITGNANLTTTGFPPANDSDCCGNKHYNHYVHVVGDTSVGGNLNIESSQNIHIGGYNYDAQKLQDGKLTVAGDLNAHATDGHITTTIDTTANKINYKSDKYNILTDGEATLTANEYNFSSNGYIGGIKDIVSDGKTYTNDQLIVDIMENYKYLNDNAQSGYVNIAGGTVTGINAPSSAVVYIASKGDMTVTGANAGNINLTSYGNDITITGPDVHADNIIVGKETDKLKVDFPSRDYTLKYTNIRDAKEVTVNGNEVITYELTNGENGYNVRDPRPENTTYLVGPDKEPEVPPVTPPDEPPVVPPVNPPTIPPENDNAKILKNLSKDTVSIAIDANPVYTPIAYAAELDDDDVNAPIRKNVDGSVTIVRAMPMY